MARGTLHPAKPADQRRGRNALAHGDISLPRDNVLRGPSIEEATGRTEWSDGVRAWWSTWQRSPQAAAFEETDWQRLAMLAVIVSAYLLRPSAAALSEIRLNEERLGATVVDRMRARMKIDPRPDADGHTAPVVPLHAVRTPRGDV